jgi:hypothetical protein
MGCYKHRGMTKYRLVAKKKCVAKYIFVRWLDKIDVWHYGWVANIDAWLNIDGWLSIDGRLKYRWEG